MSTPNNPFDQIITMVSGDGTVLKVPLPEIDDFIQEAVSACIIGASQLGATIVTMALLLLLTRAKKRRSPIFVLNMAALVLNVIRLVGGVLFYTSPWYEVYSHFSGDFSRVTTANTTTSVLTAVMTALVEIVMEISLVVQISAVLTNMRSVYKSILVASSSLIAATVIGIRMTEMAINCMLIVKQKGSRKYIWLQKADTILITASICFFSAVFTSKLGYTIHKRKQLGIRQFGPMQVIFIMCCQTMILPAIFSVLQWAPLQLHAINTCILTFIVISLPVTSIWASTVLPGQSKAHNFESGLPLWEKLSSGNDSNDANVSAASYNKIQESRQSQGATTATAAMTMNATPIPAIGCIDFISHEFEDDGKDVDAARGDHRESL